MSKKLQLARIENLLQRLDAAVVVRDPGSARAADMYEGLRRQIVQSGKNHRTHLSHLIALQNSIERGADIDLVRERLNEYLNELGIQKSSDVSNIDSFEVIEGEGNSFECIEPAIIELLDDGSIRTHQLGKARRITGPIEATNPEFNPAADLPIHRSQSNNSDGTRNRIVRLLVSLLILIIGVQLGRTLFDSSDAPRQNAPLTSTTTTSSIPVTTTTTLLPTTTSTE
jgi:hypothetical protein